jgi:hypothetical protein
VAESPEKGIFTTRYSALNKARLGKAEQTIDGLNVEFRDAACNRCWRRIFGECEAYAETVDDGADAQTAVLGCGLGEDCNNLGELEAAADNMKTTVTLIERDTAVPGAIEDHLAFQQGFVAAAQNRPEHNDILIARHSTH